VIETGASASFTAAAKWRCAISDTDIPAPSFVISSDDGLGADALISVNSAN
jgi:hypothetical protein